MFFLYFIGVLLIITVVLFIISIVWAIRKKNPIFLSSIMLSTLLILTMSTAIIIEKKINTYTVNSIITVDYNDTSTTFYVLTDNNGNTYISIPREVGIEYKENDSLTLRRIEFEHKFEVLKTDR